MLGAVGIGHQVAELYSHSRMVGDEGDLGTSIIEVLAGLDQLA